MSGVYGSSNSGGFRLASGRGSGSGSKKDDGGENPIAGFLKNLGGDIKDAATGIPAGLVMLAKDPIETTKLAAGATWYSWSPLFQGDIEEFGDRFFEHPLGPILDLTAFLSGGATIAGRTASALSKAGLASKGGRVARYGQFSKKGGIREYPDRSGAGRPTQFKRLPNTPLAKARSNAINKGLEKLEHKLGPEMPQLLRYQSRYNRKESRHVNARAAAKATTIAMYVEAGRKISDPKERKHWTSETLKHMHGEWRMFATKHDAADPLPAGYGVLYDVNDKLYKYNDRLDFENHLKTRPKKFLVSGKRGQAMLDELNTPQRIPGKGVEKYDAKFAKKQAEKLARKQNLMTDGQGSVYIVPLHTVEKMQREAVFSSRALKELYQRPTTIWKTIMLGWRPAFLVNNFVGNHFMYLMDQGIGSGTRGYVDALRQVHSEKAVKRSLQKGSELRAAVGAREFHGDAIQRWFRDQLGNTLTNNVLDVTTKRAMTGRIQGIARTGLFSATNAVADQFVRRATINNMLRSLPEVQAEMKKGFSLNKAIDRAMAQDGLRGGGRLRQMVSEQVMDVMGDYHSYTKAERAIKELVPFYGWDRHIMRHMQKMMNDRSGTVAAGARLGQVGAEETERLLGEIPAFLEGAIPLSLFGLDFDHPSRIAVLSTTGANPYATVADLFEAGSGAIGSGELRLGDSIGGNLNPLIGGLLEQLSGTDLTTGVPKNKRGLPLLEPYAETFENLTHYKLLQSLLNPQKPKKNKQTGKRTPFLFEKDPTEYALSLLGVPVKQMHKKRGKEMAARDKGRG
jgi:hypothetical protein